MSPFISAAEITRSSWAKRIEAYEAVPTPYLEFFEPLRAQGQAFPYSVLTPSYEKFIHKTTEKLICDLGDEIDILERSGNTFEVLSYPLGGISYVEVRTVLLDSRIKVTGVTRQGTPSATTLKFNSVTDYLLQPIVERIRRGPAGFKETVQRAEIEKFDSWVHLNYKFMNFAKHSLLGGEKVLHTILQSEIRERLLTVLGRTFYRTISPTHASILTDRELIMIREEARGRGDETYGGIRDYIPLKKIVNLTVNEKGSDLLTLSIQLPESERLEFLYQQSAKEDLDQLLASFRGLVTR